MSNPITPEFSPIDLEALVGKNDRDLLVAGLQALWRERATAFSVAAAVAVEQRIPTPFRGDFGMDPVSAMLKRLGATANHL